MSVNTATALAVIVSKSMSALRIGAESATVVSRMAVIFMAGLTPAPAAP
jgi:hypothetical protein